MSIFVPTRGTETQPFGCTGFSLEPSRTWHGVFCDHFHTGIDYANSTGTPIFATASGYVREAGYAITNMGAYGGNAVWLQHSPKFWSFYAHCNTLLVSAGQQVVAGQQIATMGATGNTTGPHLHFQIYVYSPTWGMDVVNPEDYYAGGVSSGSELTTFSDDVPWIEPLSGTSVNLALCNLTANGSYAVPSTAEFITAVYYDRIQQNSSTYTIITAADGNLFIQPAYGLPIDTEVRCDYVT